MFNVGPFELMILIVVAVIVVGPDKLPSMAKDAAKMLKTLRELATGARTQLRDELGPEFAELSELRNLNPRTALQRAILGDPEDGLRADLRKLDPRDDFRSMDPRQDLRDAMSDDEPVSMRKPPQPQQRPLGRNEQAPFDEDAT